MTDSNRSNLRLALLLAPGLAAVCAAALMSTAGLSQVAPKAPPPDEAG
jgi:hypothetical protein